MVPLVGEAALVRLVGEDAAVLEGTRSGSGKNVVAAHGLLLGGRVVAAGGVVAVAG
jgi:hypothetical protein